MTESFRQDAATPLCAAHIAAASSVVCLFSSAGQCCTENAVADTCGHYLYRHGKPVSQDGMALHRSIETLSIGIFSHDPLKPCNGPRCGSQSTPFSTPVALNVEFRGSDIAELINELMWKSLGSRRASHPESESGEFIEAGGIFRPPAA